MTELQTVAGYLTGDDRSVVDAQFRLQFFSANQPEREGETTYTWYPAIPYKDLYAEQIA